MDCGRSDIFLISKWLPPLTRQFDGKKTKCYLQNLINLLSNYQYGVLETRTGSYNYTVYFCRETITQYIKFKGETVLSIGIDNIHMIHGELIADDPSLSRLRKFIIIYK